MSKTSIEWCARPGTIPEGCNKVSRGCKNCYAEIMHRRLQAMGQIKYQQPFLAGAVEHEESLTIPFKWKKPRTVFVNSMSDLFHENVSISFIDKVFTIMAYLPQHTFIIVTKRADRMYDYFSGRIENLARGVDNAVEALRLTKIISVDDVASSIKRGLKNVWLIVSAEDQLNYDERFSYLAKTPAAVRGVSCEPQLGKIDLKLNERIRTNDDMQFHACTKTRAELLNWVICGGESGNKARPMHTDWALSLRDQCSAANIPFFFKQWGQWKPLNALTDGGEKFIKLGKHKAGRLLDGREYNEFPETVNYAVPA